jgi:hypothetical protein
MVATQLNVATEGAATLFLVTPVNFFFSCVPYKKEKVSHECFAFLTALDFPSPTSKAFSNS